MTASKVPANVDLTLPAARGAVAFHGFSLRAKFLLAMVLITSGLSMGALLIVRDRVTAHIHSEVERDLKSSSEYLRNFEQRRTELVQRMSVLVSDTPLLKALMTTRDPATIQDGTARIAASSGAQLFVAADASGKMLALHGAAHKSDSAQFEKALLKSVQAGRERDWWLVNGKLYEVTLAPITTGAGAERVDIGVLVTGFEIDSQFTREIASLADSEVAIGYDGVVVVSTLPAPKLKTVDVAMLGGPGVHDVRLGGERFLAREVAFGDADSSPVLLLLKSYDKATAFLVRLNWIVLSLGIIAVLTGAGLAYLISNRFTMPLRQLLIGVQALEDGHYDYPLHPRGHDEAAQLTGAFARMRETLRKSQEQVLRSARMEALGRLAGGVAHDFNNIITIISGYGELALDQAASDPQLTSFIQEIRKAGERATGLTRQLLAFSRKQVLQPQPLDLNSILASINKMLRVLMGEDVQLVISQAAKIPTVMADPGQIEQVILNLAANARDAMPGGGTLTITTGVVGAAQCPVAVPGPPAESYVELCVTDTGTGMSPEIAKQIFEPFFTTKAPGKGTGLGLATVYGIVQQSGGSIDVQSELGKGTSFRIYLPAVARKAASIAELPQEGQKTRGSGVILVVEDEEPVRRLAISGLSDRGYTVLAAANGREALQVIADRKQTINLVVSDVIMPEMGGRELFEVLKQMYPQIKVLFISGYTDRSLTELGVELETSLLPKPFTPHSLAKKVQEVLGGAKAAAAAN
ncbi:MAG TPA: ATP-binding protein [Candidatus Koribacter sp.]|jgi:signal transduction histidine kinase/ActR/RegA family two-component response regulator